MEVVRKLGFPFSLVYAFVVWIRNYCYDVGVFKSKSFNTPTLCVGNLSVGGTGKTPMIEFLVSQWQTQYKLAVLSRGYKRESKGFLLADEKATVHSLGDEPFQIHKKFPGITVAVDADRAHGITQLENRIAPDLILLDDAFQHRKVRYGLNVLLTPYDNLYSNDWYLPTGNLRDSKSSSKRAQLIIVTKCPENLKQEEMVHMVSELQPLPQHQVLFSTLQYTSVLKGNTKTMELRELLGQQFTLVTGIANPAPLMGFLKDQGLTFDHIKYKDHHAFTQQDIDFINTKKMVLTTEKDFGKLKGKVENLFYVEVRHQFLDNGDAVFLKTIQNFMR